jgi:hypothetical protein
MENAVWLRVRHTKSEVGSRKSKVKSEVRSAWAGILRRTAINNTPPRPLRALCEINEIYPLGDCTAPLAPCNDVGGAVPAITLRRWRHAITLGVVLCAR